MSFDISNLQQDADPKEEVKKRQKSETKEQDTGAGHNWERLWSAYLYFKVLSEQVWSLCSKQFRIQFAIPLVPLQRCQSRQFVFENGTKSKIKFIQMTTMFKIKLRKVNYSKKFFKRYYFIYFREIDFQKKYIFLSMKFFHALTFSDDRKMSRSINLNKMWNRITRGDRWRIPWSTPWSTQTSCDTSKLAGIISWMDRRSILCHHWNYQFDSIDHSILSPLELSVQWLAGPLDSNWKKTFKILETEAWSNEVRIICYSIRLYHGWSTLYTYLSSATSQKVKPD